MINRIFDLHNSWEVWHHSEEQSFSKRKSRLGIDEQGKKKQAVLEEGDLEIIAEHQFKSTTSRAAAFDLWDTMA